VGGSAIGRALSKRLSESISFGIKAHIGHVVNFHTVTDFNNNNPYKFTQTFGAADVRYGENTVNGFVQDDLRLSSRVTSNLGLRYEYQSITDSLHNFGPRVGVAWDATGDGKTVVRAGGGIFFDQYLMYINRRFLTAGLNPPQFNYAWTCTTDASNPCPSYPTPALGPNGGSQSRFFNYIYIPGRQLLNPYSMQFSASVERELWHNTVLDPERTVDAYAAADACQ
jgi:outer membrane receptor protein involved in Fe transport